jgi:hypothetical protein
MSYVDHTGKSFYHLYVARVRNLCLEICAMFQEQIEGHQDGFSPGPGHFWRGLALDLPYLRQSNSTTAQDFNTLISLDVLEALRCHGKPGTTPTLTMQYKCTWAHVGRVFPRLDHRLVQ